jgi:hypothetical protein
MNITDLTSRFWAFLSKANKVWATITLVSAAVIGSEATGQTNFIPPAVLNWLPLIPLLSAAMTNAAIKSLPPGLKKVALVLAGLCGVFVAYASARACNDPNAVLCVPLVKPGVIHAFGLLSVVLAALANSVLSGVGLVASPAALAAGAPPTKPPTGG